MTSKEFIDHVGGLFEDNSDLAELNKLLEYLNKAHVALRPLLFALIQAHGNPTNLMSASGPVSVFLGEASGKIRPLNTRTIFRGLEQLHSRLEKLAFSEATKDVSEEVLALLNNFSERYDQFLKNYTSPTTLLLIDAGNDVFQALKTMKLTVALTTNALSPDFIANADESEFQIFLGSKTTTPEFAAKLVALVTVYRELCELSKISESSHPLRIGKIESGSLFGRFFGESKIITMMVGLTESITRYIYRNYTNEGKLSGLSGKVNAVDNVLSLKQRLEEQGINTAGMDDRITEASTKIAKQLVALVGNEPKVVINDTTILINSETPKSVELGWKNKPLLNNTTSIDLPDKQ